MYKSPLDNFNDFYNQVFEKEAVSKQNNSKVEKSYFEYKNNQVYLRIKHDAINHGDKKHRLSAEEWKNVLENILNIENAAISNKQYSNDNVALIKVATPNGKYGVSIQFANGTNQISTIFKSTDKGIDSWIKKGSANSSTSEPLTSRDNSHTVAVVGQNPNNIIAYIKEQLNPSRQDVYRTQNIQDNFGQSVEELQEMFSEDIKNILAENEINSDEFEIEDVRLYGSYTTGKNKDTSDLDVIVQYKGSMKEDTAFNLLNDAKLTITDVNGIERKIDINPINSRLSGSIDEHIERMQEIDGAYFQSAVTAGAETSAEISDAQKEWQEKGTDSKYFKKWFGDSKVVDENGQPLVVYHGTLEKFNKFDKNSIGNRFSYDERGFFFTSSKNIANDYSASEFDSSRKGYVMPVYISAKNPLVIDEKFLKKEGMGGVFKQEDSISFWDNYQDFVLDTFDEGNYDGIIINDGDTKMVVAFEPTQIKSVDNQGTFDESNPNIYYQSAVNNNVIDWTDKFEKVPTFEEIEKHIKDIIASGEVFDTLSPNWKIDIKGGNRVVNKITNQGNFQKLQNSARKRHNKYVAGIKELINNSNYSHTSKNDKPKEKPNILNYHYFDVNIRIGDKTYPVRLECEENKKVHQGRYAKRSKQSHQNNNNLMQKNNNVKIVHLYNIKEIKQANNKDNVFYQSDYHGSPAQPNLFVENASQNHNKGFVGIDLKGNRGLTDINRNLILIGTTGDITTVLHESAHYFLNMLEELERVPDHSPKVDDVLFAIRKTLKNDGTPFTRSQHEKFAKGFEHYIYTGNARSNIFKEIYEDIKNLLKNIYEFVQKGQYFTTGEGALTEEEMKNFNNVFDEIFKLENKTVKERVFAKVLALDEKEEDEELTLFLSLFWQYRHLCPNS